MKQADESFTSTSCPLGLSLGGRLCARPGAAGRSSVATLPPTAEGNSPGAGSRLSARGMGRCRSNRFPSFMRGSRDMSRKRTFVVPAWTQLATRTAISNAIGSVACGWIQAQYTDGSGFYKWHTDGCSVSLRIAKLCLCGCQCLGYPAYSATPKDSSRDLGSTLLAGTSGSRGVQSGRELEVDLDVEEEDGHGGGGDDMMLGKSFNAAICYPVFSVRLLGHTSLVLSFLPFRTMMATTLG